MKTVTINVTKRDIELGVRRNSKLCPVARAVQRKLGNNCSVALNYIWFDFDNKTGTFAHSLIDLPPPVENFVRKFDAASTVKGSLNPFKFTIGV